MKELKQGKITYKELADWFGISYSTMRRQDVKEKKLVILSFYADFHIEITKSGKKLILLLIK